MKKKEAAMPMVDDKWQAEDDLRTLMRAEEIKANPERMKAVHKLTGKHKKAIRSIEDLKAAAADYAEDKIEGKEEA